MFKKGDLVIVSAIVKTMYLDHPEEEGPLRVVTWWKRAGWTLIHVPPKKIKPWMTYEEEYRRKCLMRRAFPPKKGLVVGRTRRATGYYIPGSYPDSYDPNGDPPYMEQEKRHEVVMVEPMDKEQWVEPWLCLEEDLQAYHGPVRGVRE